MFRMVRLPHSGPLFQRPTEKLIALYTEPHTHIHRYPIRVRAVAAEAPEERKRKGIVHHPIARHEYIYIDRFVPAFSIWRAERPSCPSLALCRNFSMFRILFMLNVFSPSNRFVGNAIHNTLFIVYQKRHSHPVVPSPFSMFRPIFRNKAE